MFGGNFAPVGWAFCNGQMLPISENETLFTLIGTTYGGDGQETFGLPDLRGRVPIHQSSPAALGQAGGVETVTLTVNQIPSHSHPFMATTEAGQDSAPGNDILAKTTGDIYNANASNQVAMNAVSIQPAGGGQPHENMQPFLCINFIISIFGIYPSKD